MPKRSEALPDALVRARGRFEKWRKAQTGRSRIPEGLWVRATRLALRYGVHRTAVALRLNGTRLKSRLPAVPGADAHEGARFVELLPSGEAHGCADLADARGGRIRVEWRGSAPDLAALSRSFFGGAS